MVEILIIAAGLKIAAGVTNIVIQVAVTLFLTSAQDIIGALVTKRFACMMELDGLKNTVMAKANSEMIMRKTIQIFAGKKIGSWEEIVMKLSKKAELIKTNKDRFASSKAALAVVVPVLVVLVDPIVKEVA